MTAMHPTRDILIREASVADAEGIARVKIATWRVAYAGIVPDSHLAGLEIREQTERMRERWLSHGPSSAATFVAESGGAVVGFATGGLQRDSTLVFDGELYAIYVLPEFQRQRIGHRFVLAVVERLVALGCTSMSVWVFAENPARRFYERLGGKDLGREKEIEIAGKGLTEVAYGWTDIGSLRCVLERS